MESDLAKQDVPQCTFSGTQEVVIGQTVLHGQAKQKNQTPEFAMVLSTQFCISRICSNQRIHCASRAVQANNLICDHQFYHGEASDYQRKRAQQTRCCIALVLFVLIQLRN